ncbi:MAG: zf-HC2 domain-containing protein [Dehalococcoidia bacterium]|nr:zf-HC2 domain-containing protein [Dehalococcoidia bacterium]
MTGSDSWVDKLIGRDEQHSPDDPCAEGMGDCGEVHDNASDFIDGEVTPELTTRIRHHLGFCSDCDGWLTSLAQTVGLLRQVPQREVPDSLRTKIDNITKE